MRRLLILLVTITTFLRGTDIRVIYLPLSLSPRRISVNHRQMTIVVLSYLPRGQGFLFLSRALGLSPQSLDRRITLFRGIQIDHQVVGFPRGRGPYTDHRAIRYSRDCEFAHIVWRLLTRLACTEES